jgi:rubrerythrin
MLRVVLAIALFALLAGMVRRAFVAARKESAQAPKHRKPRGPSMAPETIVCGACGVSFDPDASGWVCPRCGK